ncbi:MAG: ribbon-helix-helix domain-containing protein [Elusimicrobia bacterium]|nr:ribbon-helix-helix domain-containing protein [Elusimicrobiota bacterium]
MELKPFTTKLDKKTIDALKALSLKTRIPQSELVREGIALVLRRHAEDVITPYLRTEVEDLLQEDRNLLRRLSDA